MSAIELAVHYGEATASESSRPHLLACREPRIYSLFFFSPFPQLPAGGERVWYVTVQHICARSRWQPQSWCLVEIFALFFYILSVPLPRGPSPKPRVPPLTGHYLA